MRNWKSFFTVLLVLLIALSLGPLAAEDKLQPAPTTAAATASPGKAETVSRCQAGEPLQAPRSTATQLDGSTDLNKDNASGGCCNRCPAGYHCKWYPKTGTCACYVKP